MNPLEPHKSLSIIKNNIISVLSLSVKSLLEKSCYQDYLDDFTPEVNNFFTILEHMIYFCVKGNGIMLSSKMKQHPWKLFSENCKSINYNCIPTILQLDQVNNNFAKIRAVIRISLIERRLHEYLLSAFNDKNLNKKIYTPDSIVLSGNLPNIINELIGLSSLSFSFDLKRNNSHPGFYPIDYSPYLKFDASSQKKYFESLKCDIHDKVNECYWKTNYEKLFMKVNSESKQKGYVEELLLNRETKISALENRNKILESEVKTLEISVTDLQIQLTLLHEQYCKELERLGGVSTNLNIPSVKSVFGSRAEITSDRYPLARNLGLSKGDLSTSPLRQVVPFVFDGVVRDSYNKLTKMACSTYDPNNNNLKDSNENNNKPIPEKFPISKQLISEITQHYYSPTKEINRRASINNISDNLKTKETENSSDYSSRLYNFALEEQKSRIMESQELRKIMVKASRSPMIKAHRNAQLRDAPLSFDLLSNYSLDESMSDDAMDSLSTIIDNSLLYDDNFNCTNFHNNKESQEKNPQSQKKTSFPINFTNYYYIPSAPASEELNEDNFFNVDNSVAIELEHTDDLIYTVNNNVHIQSPPDIVRLSPLITAEVPLDMEPLTGQRRNFQSSENYVNGDRTSGRPRNSFNDNEN